MEINAAIDTGKYSHIKMSEIKEHLRDRSIFQFLERELKDDIDLSMLTSPKSPYPGFLDYYTRQMESMVNAYSGNERRKWGIEKNGLCLLLTWTIEIVKDGSGWHPPDLP